MSKRQAKVALSTMEAKYMTTTHVSKEVVWSQRVCLDVIFIQKVARLDYDNQSAIFLVTNLAYHDKMKHIDVQYHFDREMVEQQQGVVCEGLYLEACAQTQW